MSVSEQVGIRPVFFDMFLGSAVSVSRQTCGDQTGVPRHVSRYWVSVSEQVGIRPVSIDMFLGSGVCLSR